MLMNNDKYMIIYSISPKKIRMLLRKYLTFFNI